MSLICAGLVSCVGFGEAQDSGVGWYTVKVSNVLCCVCRWLCGSFLLFSLYNEVKAFFLICIVFLKRFTCLVYPKGKDAHTAESLDY